MMKLQPLAHACLVTLLASLVLALSAHAQPASPAGAQSEPGTTSGVIPWSAIMESLPTGAQESFDKPGEPGVNIGNTIKEAVRPIHEGLSQSGVIQSIREFDSEFGGGNRRRDNTGENAFGYSSGSPSPLAPTKSAQQIRREQQAAASMHDQLVKEVTPWAVGMMGLLAVGFATKAWIDWLHAKTARPGKLRRSARRRSHRSASSLQSLGGVQASLGAPSAHDLENIGSRTRRSRNGRSAGSSGMSDSSSGSPAPSSASSSSGTSSGRRRHRLHRPLP